MMLVPNEIKEMYSSADHLRKACQHDLRPTRRISTEIAE
jgi:hypothetical protein